MCFKPVFMFLVNFCQILQRNLVLLWSFSYFCPFKTLFRGASKIYNFCLVFRGHRLKATIQGLKNFMLALVHKAIILHDFRKNIFICKDTPLRYFKLIRISFHGLLQLFDSGKESINLECKSPSFRLCIVFFQHVDIFSSQVLPI